MRNGYYFYSDPPTPRKKNLVEFCKRNENGRSRKSISRERGVLKQADYFVSKYLNSDKNGLVFAADNDPIISRSRLATF